MPSTSEVLTSEIAIEVSHVWKKFHRGQIHDSLRDFLPALARRLVGRGPKRSELEHGDFWALADVDFQVRRGEAVGIIGPNGAGKTTLLKILARILRPNRGHYRVNGRLRALIDVGAGFHQDLTGRENIYLNGSILGMTRLQIDRKLDEIIDFSGIEPFVDTPIKRYSAGMNARLGFSVMAHMEPEILLVDEVLSVGDVAFRAKCVRHMKNLIRSDVSVVFVSHNLDQVRELCDRCVTLHQGTVRFDGDVELACRQYLKSLEDGAAETRSDTHLLPSIGRLLGLIVRNEKDSPCYKVTSWRPVTLDISYELYHSVDDLALVVGFFKADWKLVVNCNTLRDEKILPSTKGRHTISLFISGLPLCGGYYFIGIRLKAGEESIDVHDRSLTIEGPDTSESPFYLEHKWMFTATQRS